MKLAEQRQDIIWHPFTQQQTADLPILITRSKGSYVYDQNGKAYLDLISSWWVNLHGHANVDIAKAIYKQSLNLEQVIFAGFIHDPAINLCKGILKLLPEDLTKCFFSDNGSTAVEVALKMAYQYWWNKNQKQRKIFLCFAGGYHGDTIGAMSVGVGSGFHNPFKNLLFNVLQIPFPATWDNDTEIMNKEQAALARLQNYLTEQGDQIAAIILEPLVQGAAGMRMCRVSFIKQVINLVKQYNILVIFDEVMTGFGRVGTNFALEKIGICPDLICLSKGITGGFLPLALTIVKQHIYDAFLGKDFNTAFAHGHSYTANPLACAAGVASLALLESSNTIEAIRAINNAHKQGIKYLADYCSNIYNTRILGTIAAFNINHQDTSYLNKQLKTKFLSRGLLLRPLGNTVYLLPPYTTTEQQLLSAYEQIGSVLKSLMN